jgi:hypothetical protein
MADRSRAAFDFGPGGCSSGINHAHLCQVAIHGSQDLVGRSPHVILSNGVTAIVENESLGLRLDFIFQIAQQARDRQMRANIGHRKAPCQALVPTAPSYPYSYRLP